MNASSGTASKILVSCGQFLETDDRGGAGEECAEEVAVAFVAPGEAAEAAEPGEGSFDLERCRPSFSLVSMPRRPMRGMMPRWRSHGWRTWQPVMLSRSSSRP